MSEFFFTVCLLCMYNLNVNSNWPLCAARSRLYKGKMDFKLRDIAHLYIFVSQGLKHKSDLSSEHHLYLISN